MNLSPVFFAALMSIAPFTAAAQGIPPDSTINNVNSIAIQGGYIWCATYSGILRVDTNTMNYIRYTKNDGLVDNLVYKVKIAPDGVIWACSQNGIVRFDGAKWNVVPVPRAHYYAGAWDMAFGADGSVWLARIDSIAVYRKDSFFSWSTDAISKYSSVQSIAVGPDSTVWAATTSGLFRFRNDTWERLYPQFPGLNVSMEVVTVGTDGSIWCGMSIGGLCRFKDDTWSLFTGQNGMKVGFVESIGFDSGGGVWVSGVSLAIGGGPLSGGMYRYDGSNWTEMTHFVNPNVLHLSTIAENSPGNIWTGTSERGLLCWTGGKLMGYFFSAPDDIVTHAGESPEEFTAIGNHPNPFNSSTLLTFTLPEPGGATLAIHDITGRKVRTFVLGFLPAGEHTVAWDGRDGSGKALASGCYFALLRHGAMSAYHRMLLVK
jgi:hypothetical protein